MEVAMIQIPLKPTASPLAGRARLVAGRILRQAMALVTALMHRREVSLLSDLDERALKDIGLTRSDVAAALAAPYHKDPSTILLVRGVDRRARSRGLGLRADPQERAAPRLRERSES
jgi:uncharacterized protein YjiS (DUF1127 family)